MPVKSFRVVTLALGILGSLGALLTLYIVVYGILLFSSLGHANPLYQTPTVDRVVVLLYLAAMALGVSGAIASFLEPRAGGAVLLTAGTAGLASTILLLWQFYGLLVLSPLTFKLFLVAYFSWIPLLFMAGLLAFLKSTSQDWKTGEPTTSETRTLELDQT